MDETVHIEPHPLLELATLRVTTRRPLGELGVVDSIVSQLTLDAPAPFRAADATREAVRSLLRHGGYKPTGRGKPASEYLLRAVSDDALGSINAVVDACNVASLHSGLPISVVDLSRTTPPLRVAIAPKGASYVFNASGQTIDLSGLLCLFDAEGPCANAVKDAQRTKTTPGTTEVLAVIWGTTALPGLSTRVATYFHALLETAGALCPP